MTPKSAFLFPGQGSQEIGMGAALFAAFPDRVAEADAILGWSVADLCRAGPPERLNDTRYTQPAVYVVSALDVLRRRREGAPDPVLMAGHSLGEYTALFAADALDFATGLRLVARRGAVMAEAGPGAMAAVTGLDRQTITAVLEDAGAAGEVVLANHNTPDQSVLSGRREALTRVLPALEAAGAERVVPLRVSSAFHSPLMAEAAAAFRPDLEAAVVARPRVPVVCNVTARPHDPEPEAIKARLLEHFTAPVRWVETIQWMRAQGVGSFVEVGHGGVLTRLVEKIPAADPAPLSEPEAEIATALAAPRQSPPEGLVPANGPDPAGLGDPGFRRAHGARLAVVAGGMYQGIASPALVARMASAGLPAFLGTGGLDPARVATQVRALKAALPPGAPWGCNLLPDRAESALVALVLGEGITWVEAAAYVAMTPDLVHYRVAGLRADDSAPGGVRAVHRVMGKVSRPEAAEAFLAPPPPEIVAALRDQGRITAEQAEMAPRVAMCDDLVAEADSGGHTDGRSPYALVPAFLRLRDAARTRHAHGQRIRLGAAGGIGTPEAAAAAFLLGADFIVTGSVNQCTVEAGTSAAAKDMLQAMDVHDTAYAPSGQFFETGARVQVLRRGTFFPARATRLYDLYRTLDSVEAMDPATRSQVESWMGVSLDRAWADCKAFHPPEEIARAEALPRHRLALILRRYFGLATRHALDGAVDRKVDFQIQCGPALGAFNAWVSGTDLEPWRHRHVDTIADALMHGAAAVLHARLEALRGEGITAA